MDFKINSLQTKEAVKQYIDKLPEGKLYDATIKLHREKRTIPQNSLYWLWVNCIHQETGEDIDAIHEYYKSKYLTPEIKTFRGQSIAIEPSTTKLDTKRFTDYLEKVRADAQTELGVILVSPEDMMWAEFYEQYK